MSGGQFPAGCWASGAVSTCHSGPQVQVGSGQRVPVLIIQSSRERSQHPVPRTRGDRATPHEAVSLRSAKVVMETLR